MKRSTPSGLLPRVAPRRRVSNHLSGETMTFRRTSALTAGRSVTLDLKLRPLGAPGGLPHPHIPTERFRFTRGMACAWVAGHRPRILRAGDVVEVPSCRWHFIVALRHTHARVAIRPGMRFDELLVTWAAVSRGDIRPSTIRRLVVLLRRHGAL